MITTFFRRRFLIKVRMAGDLIRALHLSAQTTAEKMEVLPKLFNLYLWHSASGCILRQHRRSRCCALLKELLGDQLPWRRSLREWSSIRALSACPRFAHLERGWRPCCGMGAVGVTPPSRPTRVVGRPLGGTHRPSIVPRGGDHG